jgi:hypothetical protein
MVAALTLTVNCGPSAGEKLDTAQEKIDALEAKGVPHTQLSMARVNLHNARDGIEKRDNRKVKKAIEDMNTQLERAETFYSTEVATLGPKIQEARSRLIKAKEDLTGFQARRIDSVIAVVDSFVKVDRPLQANLAAQGLIERLPTLAEDEEKARKMRRELAGSVWVDERRTLHSQVEPRDAAVTTKTLTFLRNGDMTFVETRRGQSNPSFKEDWEFRSWGTFGFRGDTVMLSVNRYQAVRQNFQVLNQGTGEWERQMHEPFDSTIADGSQDRFITNENLREDFKRRR